MFSWFRSGLWMNRSRTITGLFRSHSFVSLAVCLGHYLVGRQTFDQSEMLCPLEEVHLLTHLCTLLHSSLILVTGHPKHDTATTVFLCWDCSGQVMSKAWSFPHTLLRINTKKFCFGLTRPKNLISRCLGVRHVFLSNSVWAFIWGEVSVINLRLMESCSSRWLSGTFFRLRTASQPQFKGQGFYLCVCINIQWDTLEVLCKVIFGFFVTAPTKDLLPQLLILTGQPDLGRVLKPPPLEGSGAHYAPRNLECRTWPGTDEDTVSWKIFYRQVCGFP